MSIVELKLADKLMDGSRDPNAVLADNELSIVLSGFAPNTVFNYRIGNAVREKTGTFSADANGEFSRVVKMVPVLSAAMQRLGGAHWGGDGIVFRPTENFWRMTCDELFLELRAV